MHDSMIIGKFKTLFGLFVLTLVFMGVPGDVEAKSVVWNQGDLPALYYFGDGNQGAIAGGWWLLGLQSGANVSIVYNAQIRNADTGVVISDGASIPISTRLIFEKIQHVDTDISWNGTGFTSDTPYGTWQSGASAPANPLLYFVDTTIWFPLTTYTETFYNYIPLSVNQPAVSTLSSSSNLSCVGGVCTVTASGPISASVVFDATYGKFYYKYIGPPGYLDYYNKVAMRGCFVSTTPWWGGPSNGECVSFPASDYLLPVPAQTITFNLTAISTNNNPTAPTIDCTTCTGTNPTKGANLNSSQTFSFNATDPDAGNLIKYRVDWNADGNLDGPFEDVPASSFVASGVEATIPHTVPASGSTYTIRAQTIDDKGGASGFTQYSINLIPSVTGQCGAAHNTSLVSVPTIGLCTAGTATAISGNGQITPWAWSCTGSGGGTTASCTATQSKCMIVNDTKYNQYGACAFTCANGATNYPTCTIPGTWSPWSSCSVSCGGGTQSRSCTLSITGTTCSADADGMALAKACNTQACPLPNLTSTPITTTQPSLVKQGVGIIASASVRNDTSVNITSAFTDEFSSKWGSGAWSVQTPLIGKTGLFGNATSPDTSDTFSINQTGTFTIQHCVDSGLAITEANETDNCSTQTTRSINGSLTTPSTDVDYGTPITLTWNTVNTTGLTCTVTGGGDSWTGPSGTESKTLTTDTAYVLACTDGTTNVLLGAVSIDVDVEPVLTATRNVVDPVPSGVPVDLVWNTKNGNEALCALTGGTIATNPLDPTNTNIPIENVNMGSTTVTISSRTTYTLTCPNGTDTTTIEIVPRGTET